MRSAGSGGYMAIQFVYPIYLYITVCIRGFIMAMRYGLDAVGVSVCVRWWGLPCPLVSLG